MRSEQDEAYEQSLRCDQQKDKEAAERQQLEKVTSSYYIAVVLCWHVTVLCTGSSVS